MTEWTHGSEVIEQVLAEMHTCYEEAQRCKEHGLYRPACVMLGAALEAVLLATIMLGEPSLKAVGNWPGKKDPLRLDLGEMVDVAFKAGWIPAEYRGRQLDLDEGDLGNAVDWMRWLRNLLHPGA